MAKTVAYFYDPDVGNFHYGASGAGRGRASTGAGRRSGCRGAGAAPAAGGGVAQPVPPPVPAPRCPRSPLSPPVPLSPPHPRPRSELQRSVVPGGRRERPLCPWGPVNPRAVPFQARATP